MTNLEYGDYYRFIVSVGVASVVLALLFPWLVLSEPFDLMVTEAKLEQLTPVAQEIVKERQTLTVCLIRAVPFISIAFLVVGIVLVGVGLYLWRGRQQATDIQHDLQTEKLQKELEQMSEPDIREKAKREILSQESRPKASISNLQVKDYLDTEARVASAFRRCLEGSSGYTVETNRRVGAAQFDIVIRNEWAKHKDLVVEIKVINKGFHFGWFSEVAERLRLSCAAYGGLLAAPPRALLLIVAKKGVIDESRFFDYVSRLRELELTEPDFRVRMIDPREIDSVSCEMINEWSGGLIERSDRSSLTIRTKKS